ncbi:hypothetical protein F994_02617 [Acinetobacter bohemicus ANC 3994]|uniref:Uncharacterized protein n=1 Tax=Acinetobacter bohemicus ANC 3994 TaxID=1217715 RepID=N8Q6T5_9GAMM|nr:hypothetical protein F994_02617 [Acinetobacter bohemicus ANC 3994]
MIWLALFVFLVYLATVKLLYINDNDNQKLAVVSNALQGVLSFSPLFHVWVFFA